MLALARKFLSTQHMVKPEMRRGEIPGSKEAYGASLSIALPAVVEMVSIQLMGMIDTVMVGRLDPYGIAVAAVGLTIQPRFIFLSLFFALNTALTAIIARNKGAGDMAAARNCLRAALVINFALGAVITVVAVALARPMMQVAGAQPETLLPATQYFRITQYALLFQVMTMAICAAQRACGNTKITMKVNVTAKVISVALNFLLIEGRFGFPRLEVEGAAISTVIAAGIAFLLAAATVFRKSDALNIAQKEQPLPDTGETVKIFNKPLMRQMTRLASGSAVEQIALRSGFFLFALVVANLGTAEFAAHLITMQLMALSFTFADGIGVATTSLVGQNLGKKRPDLSVMYGKIGLRLAIGCAFVLSMVCIIFRYQFPVLFTQSPEVIGIAAGLILWLALILPFQTAQVVMGGTLRGAGDTRFVAVTMVLTVGILRPFGGWLLTYPLGIGLFGAWIAVLCDQIARLVMLLTRFIRGKWIV